MVRGNEQMGGSFHLHIRATRKVLRELGGLMEELAVIVVMIWGLVHLVRVLFVLAR